MRKPHDWNGKFWLGLLVVCFVACIATYYWPAPETNEPRDDQTDKVQDKLATSTPSLENQTAEELEAFLKLPQMPKEATEPIDIERLANDFEDAMATRRSRFPNDPKTEHLAGLFQLRLKRTQSAEPSLRRCVELSPNDQKMRMDLAELLTQTGRDDEALQVLEGFSATAPLQVDYLWRLGDCQLRFGNLESAERTFTSATQADPTQSVLWVQLGNAKLQQQKIEEASQCAKKAIELNANSPDAWLLSNKSLKLLKQTEEAQAALLRWQEVTKQANATPRSTFEEKHPKAIANVIGDAFRSLGNLYRATGDNAQANEMFERALQLDPVDAVTIADWASLLRRMGNLERVTELTRVLVRVNPHEAAYYQNLASVSMELNRPLDAEASLRLACVRLPKNGGCHLMLAQFLLLAGKRKEAVAPAEIALRILQNAEAAEVLTRIKTGS